MRWIAQPGPAQQPRMVAYPVDAQAIKFNLEKGAKLLAGIAAGFAAAGFESGVVELNDVALSPFAYVMPALSKTGENAAFYSDIFRPEGISSVERGALTFGRRGGAPFFHCHAIWREADGQRSGGHILPEETCLAENVSVRAVGIKGAAFEGHYDPETNFTLFGPVETSLLKQQANAFAIRLRPNQDFCRALEDFCGSRKIRKAHIRGGVGSTIGARLVDRAPVEAFATEVFVRQGEIRLVDGSPIAAVAVDLVDYTGALSSGILVRGDNPVLMTFELVLVIDE